MNLTKSLNVFDFLKKSKDDSIIEDILEDFDKYPDFKKIDLYFREAKMNQNQIQFDDSMRMLYVFGKFDENKNSPLAGFKEKKVTIRHKPGHVIHRFTGMDILASRPRNKDSESDILIEYGNSSERDFEMNFKKSGDFIKKFIKKFKNKYPELEECNSLNYRGITDIENDIPPVVGYFRGNSIDRKEYTYPYRCNEDPQQLEKRFRNKTREQIEKSLKDRDNGLYQKIWRRDARELKDFNEILKHHIEPLLDFCEPLFSQQKYIFERNKTDIKITYRVSNKLNFENTLDRLLFDLPEQFEFFRSEFTGAEGFTWGILKFKIIVDEESEE